MQEYLLVGNIFCKLLLLIETQWQKRNLAKSPDQAKKRNHLARKRGDK